MAASTRVLAPAAVADPWAEALSQLRSDPDAELPQG